LSVRTLTRTLWVRQGLVAGVRDAADVESLVERLIGLQAQENLAPYLSLAARLDQFAPTDLADRIADRRLVRFLTMRGTVHVLTPADALRLRGWVQPALDRVSRSNALSRPARDLTAADLASVLRPLLDGGERSLPVIGEALAAAFPAIPEAALRNVARERLPLLQTPPRGLWKRSGGVVYAFADDYLARPFAEVDLDDLVLRYLAAYGPATAADMTAWSGVTRLGPVFTALAAAGRLTTCTDAEGRTLYDAPGAPIAEEDLDLAPVLLGTYDNVFLSHAERSRIAPEDARRGWMGANGGAGATLFLDGLLAGIWRVEDGRVVVRPFRTVTRSEQTGIDAEVARIEALLAVGG
jgi:hypothetical protein